MADAAGEPVQRAGGAEGRGHAASCAAGPAFEHRLVHADLTLVGRDDAPLRGASVTVEQVRHAFSFGNIGFDFIALANDEAETGRPTAFGGVTADRARRLVDPWFELFNAVTLPFYWRNFEPQRGQPDTHRLLRAARWFVERGASVKGHPLVWHTLAPRWLLDLEPAEIEATLRGRITREVTAFAGTIDTWDAINEAVIAPVFDREPNGVTPLARQLGRVGIVRLAFETARAANPHATLILNDFDMSPAYEQLIEACLDAGIRVDGLGLQSHMHQGYWGEERTRSVLDRFARFGLPLHLSESTLLSGALMPPEIEDLNDYRVAAWPSTPDGEERQAGEISRHYTTLVGHPAVHAVTYWGLTDDGAWLGAPSGLLRADGTPKPAYDALRGLIKGDWWIPRTTVVADDDGRVRIDGFAGEYRVEVDGSAAHLDLGRPGPATAVVRIS